MGNWANRQLGNCLFAQLLFYLRVHLHPGAGKRFRGLFLDPVLFGQLGGLLERHHDKRAEEQQGQEQGKQIIER